MIVNLRIWFIKTYILLHIQLLLWKATLVQEDFAFAFVYLKITSITAIKTKMCMVGLTAAEARASSW